MPTIRRILAYLVGTLRALRELLPVQLRVLPDQYFSQLLSDVITFTTRLAVIQERSRRNLHARIYSH